MGTSTTGGVEEAGDIISEGGGVAKLLEVLVETTGSVDEAMITGGVVVAPSDGVVVALVVVPLVVVFVLH